MRAAVGCTIFAHPSGRWSLRVHQWADLQIDFHVGVGLSSAAVDHLIGIGYSFRFQAIRR
jgi:hypothetical protein